MSAIPLSVDKTEGPVTVLAFLGIEIDTVEMVFQLARLLSLVCLAIEEKNKNKSAVETTSVFAGSIGIYLPRHPHGTAFCRRLAWATKGVAAPPTIISVSPSP